MRDLAKADDRSVAEALASKQEAIGLGRKRQESQTRARRPRLRCKPHFGFTTYHGHHHVSMRIEEYRVLVDPIRFYALLRQGGIEMRANPGRERSSCESASNNRGGTSHTQATRKHQAYLSFDELDTSQTRRGKAWGHVFAVKA